MSVSIPPTSALKLYPNLPDHQYITEFEQAYELHIAAGASRLMRNRQVDPAAMQQRRALLDIITEMLVNERNKALDKFCTSWLKYRQLPIPEKETAR